MASIELEPELPNLGELILEDATKALEPASPRSQSPPALISPRSVSFSPDSVRSSPVSPGSAAVLFVVPVVPSVSPVSPVSVSPVSLGAQGH